MSTKRKIEDYKGKEKIAIECKDDAEFEIIAKLLEKKSNAPKFGFCIRCSDGNESDSHKNFENKGYTIYPASDFLEEDKSISKEDLIEGEIYLYDNKHIVIYPKGGNVHLNSNLFTPENEWMWNLDIKNTTPEQKHWLNECIKADKFIPYNKAMKSFFELPYKFNIGDEIKAKPGGYYISSPQHFAEIHKALFSSEKSRISGKIIERTQAQGFNWYRVDDGNWITEEGLELVKNKLEYVKCIKSYDNRFTLGKIYKVESVIDERIVLLSNNGKNENPNAYLLNGGIWSFEPATKEDYDKQAKSITEDKFYKKEEKEMLEMLAYPKDNYFKAVVVKDIHKKNIITPGNMPNLIPKGYQTWFSNVDTYHRERILSKKNNVCPEKNRWAANIPAEYFQIVEDEKHNDIAEKEWIPQVGEYIVYNNTDVLKVTKVEPNKYHRYWISHTPNSFSGGGFGWDAWKPKIRKATLQEIESIVHTLTDEEILEVCKQFYPVGTVIKNVFNGKIDTVDNNDIKFESNNSIITVKYKTGDTDDNYGTIWSRRKGFTSIISSPIQKEVKSWIQKQDEILNDVIKQHPLTPKECYSSTEIIIPQVIKAQKTIQKITIESPTELDLKLKTIKPKQIQTIKI